MADFTIVMSVLRREPETGWIIGEAQVKKGLTAGDVEAAVPDLQKFVDRSVLNGAETECKNEVRYSTAFPSALRAAARAGS